MSVQLCCWKQNEGVSGTDPGSSRVYPEETVREDEPNVPCSKIYPTCEDYCSALNLQSPVAGKWSCVCIKARAEAHIITVYFVSHHLTQAFSSDSLSAHRLVTVLFCSLLYSMFFSHRDVIPSINFFYAYWQSCCVTTLTNCSSHREEPASPLSVPGIRHTLSVPWGFLMKLLHNHSLCKHVQTQVAVLFLEKVLDLSQPTSASKPAASFIVFGGCSHILLISTCFVFLFFRLLTLTGFAQGWLAWCVTIGLAIVGHDFNRNEVVAV